MITRLCADCVAPIDGTNVLYSPGFVDLDDGWIAGVGAVADAPLPAGGRTEDVGGLLMPGFVNTHAHSPMTVLRGAGEGLPLDRWLGEVIWPRESRLTPEGVEAGMVVGSAEMLLNGVTTTAEMYFFPESVASGAERAGIRAVVGAAIIEGLERFGTPERQFADALALREASAGRELIEIAFGPHAAYTLGDDVLRAIAETAVEEDMLLHIHVAETAREGDPITERTGRTVPEHLADLGVLEARVLAAHCVWLEPGDIDLFAGSDVGVAHCPGSNGKIASGIAPVREMRATGIPVGAATDGPASNGNLDVLEEARLALLYSRLREQDAAALGVGDALAMITSEAAAALGRSDIGSLVPGNRADLIRIDVDHPEYEPVEDPADLLGHLIWAGSARDVTDVWVGGERVVEARALTTIDLEEARAEAARVARYIAG